jgi:hypothetical protein
MNANLRALALKPKKRVCRWAILGAVLGFANVYAEAQYAAGEQTITSPLKHSWAPSTALPRDLDPLLGSSWGRGGPWAGQEPYTPRPKPRGWVDPEPSRWLWTGECDPYACPYRSQDDVSPPGQDPRTAAGATPPYRSSPPP